MTVGITRHELGAGDLRREARRCRDGAASRRMLALALVLEGASREEAARAAGMDRQTLRDWVHRYNAEGLAGLRDRPALHGRRQLGLLLGREARFAVRLHERSVGKVLRRPGFARLSVRPRHPKADEAAQAAFKKASPSWWRERCPSTPAASRSRSGSKMKPVSASRVP